MKSAQERAEEMMKALESSSIFGGASGWNTNQDMEKYQAQQREAIEKELNKFGRPIGSSQDGSLDGFSIELKPLLKTSMNDLEALILSMLDNSVSQENIERCFQSSTAAQRKAADYTEVYAKKIFELTVDIGEQEKFLSKQESKLNEVVLRESSLNGQIDELAKDMDKQKGKEEKITKDLDDNKKAVMGQAAPQPGFGVVINSMKTASEIEKLMRERMAIQKNRHQMKLSMDKLQDDLKRMKSEIAEISKQKKEIEGKIQNLKDKLSVLGKERDLVVEFGVKIKTIALFLGQWKGKIDVVQDLNKKKLYIASLGSSVRDLLEFLASSSGHQPAIASLVDYGDLNQLLTVFSQTNIPPLSEYEEF